MKFYEISSSDLMMALRFQQEMGAKKEKEKFALLKKLLNKKLKRRNKNV